MAVQIQTFSVGPIDTNCYVVSDEFSGNAFLIDPGIECDEVLAAISDWRLTDILLTHAHFDHMGGAARIVAATGARLWVHAKEAGWLANPMLNLSAMAGICAPVHAPTASVLLSGGETRVMLGNELYVVHVPGHTPGHVAYFYTDVVFTGDLIFAGSVGRTDFPGGRRKQLLDSIAASILTLPDDTRLLPGHGPATTVGAERRRNPYLQELAGNLQPGR